MERAAKLVRKNAYSKRVLGDDDFARAIWPAAVGKAIAAHTARVKLVRTTLVVEVEDAIWQKQLYPLTRQILNNLAKVTGSADLIQDVEFRVAIPRRQAARVTSPAAQSIDEADSIADPVLRKIYRLSRNKVIA